MGFRNDALAYVKDVEYFPKFSNVLLTISNRNPTTKKYTYSFYGHVYFYGRAHLLHPSKGQRIRLKSTDVTNEYVDKTGKQMFNKTPICRVYDYEIYYKDNKEVNDLEERQNRFEEMVDGTDLPF